MNRGFTLLEILVATLIMGIAVVGMLSGISASMRNADRLSDYDRAVMLARGKMDALLLDYTLPRNTWLEGSFDPELMGGTRGGWRGQLTMFDLPPRPQPGWLFTERIELEVWWMSGTSRRTFSLEGFRRNRLQGQDLAGSAPAGAP